MQLQFQIRREGGPCAGQMVCGQYATLSETLPD